MHVTVVAFGTPGDVEPLLAVADGLHDRGHEVRLATHPSWELEVRNRGLEFTSLHGDIEHLVRHPVFRKVVDARQSPLALVRALQAAVHQGVEDMPTAPSAGRGATWFQALRSLTAAAHRFDDAVLDDLDAACGRTDAVVYGAPLAPVVHHLAAAHGLPTAAALIQPLDYLGGPGHVLDAARRGLPGEALRRLGRDLIRGLAWQGLYRPALSRWSRQHGRTPPPWTSPFPRWRRESLPMVYGLSPAVLMRPDSWPADWEMVGFWFGSPFSAPAAEKSPPPEHADLEAFLDGDQDVVYVDFGSMVTADTGALVRYATEATAAVGARALIQRGWADLAVDRPAPHVRFVDPDQRERALRAADVLVHHGGVMATATGLRRGLPTVVVPSILDQFAWGRRVAEIGAGPTPVPRRQLNTASLAEALRGAFAPATRHQARAVATGLNHDDGPRRAAEILETALGSGAGTVPLGTTTATAVPGRSRWPLWLEALGEYTLMAALIVLPERYRARAFFEARTRRSALTETTLYRNMGYWEDGTEILDEACRAMADFLADTAKFGPGNRVLDVGVGYAEADIHWTGRFESIHIEGIDIVPEHIRQGTRRVAARGVSDRVSLRLGSAIELPYADHGFDAVVSLEAVLHFVPRDQFFREARRVLVPGGRLAVVDPVSSPIPGEGVLGAYLRRAMRAIPEQNIYARDEYARRLEAAGFIDVDVQSIRHRVHPPYAQYLRRRIKDPEVVANSNALIRAMWQYWSRMLVQREGDANEENYVGAEDYIVATATTPIL